MRFLFGISTLRPFVFGLFLSLPLACSARSAEPSLSSLESRLAQLEAKAGVPGAINSGDNAWLLVSAALVSEEEETLGLDLSQHGESAYND